MMGEVDLPDLSLLSKADRAVALSTGRIFMYLFKKELTADERTILQAFARDAGSYFRVVVAKSPLPDRHQVRIGPALVVYEESRLRAVRLGVLESRQMLDRWLRSIKMAPSGES
jgi:hypothetical protein